MITAYLIKAGIVLVARKVTIPPEIIFQAQKIIKIQYRLKRVIIIFFEFVSTSSPLANAPKI